MGERRDTKDRKIITEIRKFKKKIGAEKVILFGSYARGDYDENSDLDLIIVSKKFSKKDFLERSVGLHKHLNLDYPVDFICFSRKEFEREKKKVSIVSEALREGIEI